MKRRVFNILAAVSLMLCIAVLMLWVWTGVVRPMRSPLRIHKADGSDWLLLYSSEGRLYVQLLAHDRGVSGPYWQDKTAIAAWKKQFHTRVAFDWHGFRVEWGPQFGTDPKGIVWMLGNGGTQSVPHWFAALALALLPFRWFLLLRGRWREEELLLRGCCVKCGYDLRASKERCPECGTAIPERVVERTEKIV